MCMLVGRTGAHPRQCPRGNAPASPRVDGQDQRHLKSKAPQSPSYQPTMLPHGELAEWSIAPVLKTGSPQGLQGSNPWLSAKANKNESGVTADANSLCHGP